MVANEFGQTTSIIIKPANYTKAQHSSLLLLKIAYFHIKVIIMFP